MGVRRSGGSSHVLFHRFELGIDGNYPTGPPSHCDVNTAGQGRLQPHMARRLLDNSRIFSQMGSENI